MRIRDETTADIAALTTLVTRAFDGAPHASGTEAQILTGLRDAGALVLNLVADAGNGPVGQAAFSPVNLPGWYGLGPVAVDPVLHGTGIGGALIRAGLDRLRAIGAAGCVVLGDPGYYRRFGFAPLPGLVLDGVPPEYFMARVLAGPQPTGAVVYHAAFYPG